MPYKHILAKRYGETKQEHQLRVARYKLLNYRPTSPPLSQVEQSARNRAERKEKYAEEKSISHARRDKLQAQIDKDGGLYEPALFDGDKQLNAELVDGRFGLVWLVSLDEEERYGKKWIPFDNSHESHYRRSTVQQDLGLRQKIVLFPAKVVQIKGYRNHWRIEINREVK